MVDDNHLAITTNGVRDIFRFEFSGTSVDAAFHIDCPHSYVKRVLFDPLDKRSADILAQSTDIHLAIKGLLDKDVKSDEIVESWFFQLYHQVDIALFMLHPASIRPIESDPPDTESTL